VVGGTRFGTKNSKGYEVVPADRFYACLGDALNLSDKKKRGAQSRLVKAAEWTDACTKMMEGNAKELIKFDEFQSGMGLCAIT